MNTRIASRALAVILLLVVPPLRGPTWAQQPAETAAVERFHKAVNKYVALHRQFERYLPPPLDFTDPREAERSMRAMAEALRRAKPLARKATSFAEESRFPFAKRSPLPCTAPTRSVRERWATSSRFPNSASGPKP